MMLLVVNIPDGIDGENNHFSVFFSLKTKNNGRGQISLIGAIPPQRYRHIQKFLNMKDVSTVRCFICPFYPKNLYSFQLLKQNFVANDHGIRKKCFRFSWLG